MSTLDLTPSPAAARPRQRILAHAGTEATLLLRNGEQLLLALVIPVALLFIGRFVGGPFGSLASLTPSVLALAVWSSAFTSVAIATGFERRYGVLERLAATPLGRPGLIVGKALATASIVVLQLVVVSGIALVLGWRPAFSAASGTAAVLAVVLGSVCFAGAGLLLAGRLRAEITLALANLIYVVLLAGGALVLSLAAYPAGVQLLIALLPTAALGEGLRAYAQGELPGWPLLSLLAWAIVAIVAAWKGFRWVS